MEYESVLSLVKRRRSVRRFKPDSIPDDYLDKIIKVARQAPSGFNMQPWEFIIVKDEELRSKIVDLFPPRGDLDAPNDFRIAPVYITTALQIILWYSPFSTVKMSVTKLIASTTE